MSLDTVKKTTEVTQNTHDNLNLNANLQVGDTDVSGGNPVPISGTVTANAGTNLNTSLLALESGGNLAAAAASLSVLDDWDETDRAKVNLIVGQAGITGGAGAVASNTPRITHASDDPVTTSVQLIDDIVYSTNAALSKAAAIAGQLDDAATTAATEDNVAPVRITAQRAFHTNLRNNAGTEIATAANPLRIDPTGTTTQPVSQITSPWVTADNQTITDNAGFTDGTSKVFTAGYIFDEVAGTALTENDVAAARIDSKRAIVQVLEDATTRGRRQTVTAAGNAQIDVAAIAGTATAVNNGTASAGTQRVTLASDSTGNIATIGTSVTPGSGAALLGKAEDLASANADTLVGVAAIRRDTPVANANVSADGDYTQFLLDNLGKLWTAQTQTEDAGHTSGDRGSFILGVRNTANTTSTSADRDYAPISTDLWDAPIAGMRRQSTTLTAINTTYDDSPTTATSATVDSSMFRMGLFVAEVTESGTATDITFTLQMSPDGTTWYDYRVGPWVKYRFDDATIAAHTSNTLKICEPFFIECSNIRMLVTCTGTDASNSFTVANAKFELQN